MRKSNQRKTFLELAHHVKNGDTNSIVFEHNSIKFALGYKFLDKNRIVEIRAFMDKEATCHLKAI